MDSEFGGNRVVRRSQGGTHGIIFGVITILAGVLLLLDRMDYFNFRSVWKLWPLIFVGIGIAKIVDSFDSTGRVFGGFLTVVGGIWLARNFGLIRLDSEYLLPIVLIGFGLVLLYRAIARRKEVEAPGDVSQVVNQWAVFSGSKLRNSSTDFRGGALTAIFGGIEVDLRKAAMRSSRIVLDTTAMFGGVQLRIPENWTVTLRGTSIFGGFEDKTSHPEGESAPQYELIITGIAAFGGVEIDN
jgi:predicted membrane protein